MAVAPTISGRASGQSGGHAASLAIYARDRKEVPLIFQLLIYPELDDRTGSTRSVPPAWIGVGSIDLFVEEDMEYARRLLHAGVATELLVVPGAFHGFDIVAPDAAVSKQFTASWKSALRKAFATGRAV